MTEGKQPTEGQAGPVCEPGTGCPICRVLWPTSTVGKIIVLAVLLAAAVAAAWSYFLRPDVDRAFAEYETLKRAGRQDEASEALDGVVLAAIRLYRERRFEESRRLFERIIEREPDQPLVLNYLGLLEGALGEEEKSIRYFRKAVEIDPLSSQPYWNLALVYYNRKDYPACETELRLAMKYARLKSQYRLLYALCAVEQKQEEQVIVTRLKETVLAAVSQAQSVNPEDLRPGGSLAAVFAETAKRLAEHGDTFGYDKLAELSTTSSKKDVRDFAARLLARRPRY